MNYQRLVEEKVGSAPQDGKYVWFDADTLIYLCALRADKLDLPIEVTEKAVTDMYDRFVEALTRECKGMGELVVVSCLSPSRTFRHEVLDTYKANRIGKWKPPLLAHYVDTFKELYPHLLWEMHEADDICSILNYQIPGHIVASGDKDLRQCPGTLYNPRTESVETINKHTSIYNRLYQWLVGDSADGYKGCYMIGDKKAHKILCEYPDLDMSNLIGVISEIESVYATQNAKLEAKEAEPHDMHKQFMMSQMLTERWDADAPLPDPISYLSSL